MSSHIIITIFRNKLIVCRVKPSAKHPISYVREFGWDENTLGLIFSKIKGIYKTKVARILFSREVSYILHFPIPRELGVSEKRQVALEKLLERVPDEIELTGFDYQVVNPDAIDDEQDVIAFAPIRTLHEAIKLAVSQSNVCIEASEPEEVAKTRNINPIIGIALKENFNQSDETVLNMPFGNDASGVDQPRGQSSLKNSILVFLIVFLFTAAIGLAYFFFIR